VVEEAAVAVVTSAVADVVTSVEVVVEEVVMAVTLAAVEEVAGMEVETEEVVAFVEVIEGVSVVDVEALPPASSGM
jgi:hypothetical protein